MNEKEDLVICNCKGKDFCMSCEHSYPHQINNKCKQWDLCLGRDNKNYKVRCIPYED